jgi:hypothetical protein
MRKSKATEALRVATDVAAIKAVLKKHGYTIRKRPKQAAWTIYITPPLLSRAGGVNRETTECYTLTYQPAPISAWVLHHPQNEAPNRQSLLNIIQSIIQSALAKQPAGKSRRVS